jgi:hypothetical protein
MIKQEVSEKIIDIHYNEAKEQYTRILSSRTEYRERTLAIFTLLLGILGAIVIFQNTDKTFYDLWLSANACLKTSYVIFTLLGLIFFFLTFFYSRSYTLSNVHLSLIANARNIINSGDSNLPIELTIEHLTVNEEYYVKVEFIKAYSSATDKIIKDLRKMGVIYIVGFISFIISFLMSVIIIFQ